MSSSTVVVEPPPPAVAGPATDAAPVSAPSSAPSQHPQLNGSRSPAAVVAATPESNGVAASEDVEMEVTSSEASPKATANGSTDAIKTESSAPAPDATNGTDETSTPMEVDEPATPAASDEAVKPEPVVTIHPRAPEDDARALALAARRLELQIAFVENARKKIADESHPDFSARMVPIDAERERLLALAASKESYWTNCTSVIFAYECDEASSEFMMNCDKLRHEMLDEIHQEIEIINNQRKGSSSARKTTRKTRSARSKAGGGSGSGAGSEEKAYVLDAISTAQKAKKRVGNVYTHVENKLAQSEVDHDLRELHNSMDAVSKKRRMDATESPFVAKYHRANFLYRDAIFQEGDEIFVRNLMNGSEYIAVICSITSTELFVLSEKGKYFRLVFMDLRQGRVIVSALTAEQTAALNEREALRI